MTYPRSHLIDEENGGYYHLISRCVRRAWLCGFDKLTGRNFNHRRAWIEKRILELGEIFSVAIYGYAVMSNHYHINIKLDPKQTKNFTDREVAERWSKLCPKKKKGKSIEQSREEEIEQLLKQPERLEVLRRRLGSISWFMRFINEPLARMANKEDGCKGRFWEGRFKSQALLDEPSLLSCMAYVDLNPIKSGASTRIETSMYTSIKRRIQSTSVRKKTGLLPIVFGVVCPDPLSITLEDYISLVKWTSKTLLLKKEKKLCQKPHKILNTLSLDEETWINCFSSNRNRWQRAFGLFNRLELYANRLGQKWVKQYQIKKFM